MLNRLFIERKDIKPGIDFQKKFRRLLRSPGSIFVIFFTVIFCAVLTPGQYLFGFEFLPRLALNVVLSVAYTVWTWLFLSKAVPWGMRRNIPWFWGQIVMYQPLTVLFSFAIVYLFDPAPNLTEVVKLLLISEVVVVFAVFISLLVLQREILREFAQFPETFPLWWPGKVQDCGLQSTLDNSVRGPVRRLEAENQYVRVVTTNGEGLARLTMTEAEALLPRDSGIRVHRSHWVAKNNIADFWFENGNPRIRDTEGVVIPVSRSMSDQVREYRQNT